MAEEKQNSEEKTEISTEGTESAKAVSTGGGKKKLLLFGGIGLGTIIIGVVLAIFVLKPMMTKDSESSEDGKTEEHAEKSKKKKHKEKKLDSHGNPIKSPVFVVKDIIVNPAGTGGTRFLSVSFGFTLGSTEAEAEFADREPLIRDALITILSSKTIAQLTDPKQKEIIRYQIKKRVEKIIDTDELEGVYYTSFVLQ